MDDSTMMTMPRVTLMPWSSTKLEAAASKLKKELEKIESDKGMKAKECHSAKREG
jgi:hypothetical protein